MKRVKKMLLPPLTLPMITSKQLSVQNRKEHIAECDQLISNYKNHPSVVFPLCLSFSVRYPYLFGVFYFPGKRVNLISGRTKQTPDGK